MRGGIHCSFPNFFLEVSDRHTTESEEAKEARMHLLHFSCLGYFRPLEECKRTKRGAFVSDH